MATPKESVAAMAKRVIPNWQTMIDNLPPLTERQVHLLIAYEVANRRNRYMLRRLHQRFCSLRMERERAALLDRGVVP